MVAQVTEGRLGGVGGNETIIPCKMGALPPAGLCPGYWPKVPPALTHVSSQEGSGSVNTSSQSLRRGQV